MGTVTRVVIVDDEVHARGRLREMLAAEPDAELVGEYATVPEAIAGIRETHPDLLFLDVQLLGRNGFEVLEALGPDALPTTVFVTAYRSTPSARSTSTRSTTCSSRSTGPASGVPTSARRSSPPRRPG